MHWLRGKSQVNNLYACILYIYNLGFVDLQSAVRSRNVCSSVTRDDLWIGWRKHLDRKPSMYHDVVLHGQLVCYRAPQPHNHSLLPDDLPSFQCLLQNQWEPEKSVTCTGKDLRKSLNHLLRHLPFSQFSERTIYLHAFVGGGFSPFWAQWITLW